MTSFVVVNSKNLSLFSVKRKHPLALSHSSCATKQCRIQLQILEMAVRILLSVILVLSIGISICLPVRESNSTTTQAPVSTVAGNVTEEASNFLPIINTNLLFPPETSLRDTFTDPTRSDFGLNAPNWLGNGFGASQSLFSFGSLQIY